jgi:hypothetical protein
MDGYKLPGRKAPSQAPAGKARSANFEAMMAEISSSDDENGKRG